MDWIERCFVFYKLRIVLCLSEDILHALERLCSVGFDRCSVKYKHLLKAELLRLEEVQMTAEEDKKHMLSYIGYMALDTRTASGVLEEN
jgi:hypothetical protein